MPLRITHHPPLPRSIADRSFLQRIELYDGRQSLGQAVWHLPQGAGGVVQLVDLTVAADSRRQGHATKLINEVLAQARSVCRMKRAPLRRIWIAVEQKTQVLARAFLTQNGFHHTSTIHDLLQDQDLLIYVRSFD